MPSNPVDAKGLLRSAIRQNDPVLFIEPKRVYRASKGDVPDGDYEIPIGQAKVVREGSRITSSPGAAWRRESVVVVVGAWARDVRVSQTIGVHRP